MSGVIAFFHTPAFWGLSWLQLLGLYISPGLGYSAFHLIKLYRDRPSQFARDLLATIRKKKEFTDYLADIFVYTIAITCISLGWPAFAVWAYFKARSDAAWEVERDKPDFTCLPEYLVSKVKPTDAETASYVIDPLGTVPLLPFGHLNKGWVNFMTEMTDGEDELWSFFIPKGGKCGKYRFAATSDIQGYAKVRDNKILGEFIFESD